MNRYVLSFVLPAVVFVLVPYVLGLAIAWDNDLPDAALGLTFLASAFGAFPATSFVLWRMTKPKQKQTAV